MEDFFFHHCFSTWFGSKPEYFKSYSRGANLEGLRKTTDLCWGKEGGGGGIKISLKTRFNVAQRCISSVW